MRISLIPSVEYIKEEDLKNKIAVVIDVLRATSVITTAVGNGALEVNTALEIDEALNLRDENSLLGGERKALKIEGFDLSNSPVEYSRKTVEGKKIILTTTNGTKAIHKSMFAEKIYIGCMLNGRAVARKAFNDGKDIVMVCAGTYGKFSIDDFICAGKIIYGIAELEKVYMDDFAAAAFASYRDNRNNLIEYVSMAGHYKYLISIGLQEDIKHCFQEDIFDIVPEFISGRIIAS